MNANEIEGFTDPADLDWLAERAAKCDLAVEFGSWVGRSTIAMATAKRVIAVDTWKGSKEHEDEIKGGRDIWSEWQKNTARIPHITAIRCDLRDAHQRELLIYKLRASADMVFVDAAHDYHSVRSDILTAMAILKPAGLLCGHDYHRANWPGVVQAVDELVPHRKTSGVIWYQP